MGDRLEERVARRASDPERGADVAIIDAAGSHTHRAVDHAADRVASALLSDRRLDRVAIVCAAGLGWIAGALGAWRAGAAIVPLDPTHPVAELLHPVTDAGVGVILCSSSTRELADALARSGTGEIAVIDVDAVLVGDGSISREHPAVDADDDALIVYTSGTTGRPKGVVHTHRSVAAQISGMVAMWGWTADDRIVCVLPLHHVHGIVNVTLTPLWVGATLEAPGRFDAIATWERLASGEVTVFMAVPTVYARLVAAWDEADVVTQQRWSEGAARLRLMVSGSAALPVTTLERWRSISGHVLLERYGMTELGMVLSNTLERRVPGHVGWPFPGVEVRIESEDDQPGELLIRSEQVFDRYLGRPEATADSFDGDWFRTGDVAIETDEGFRLLGRASIDIIKSGGEKISALEIEEVYRTHPSISDCAVVGIDDDEWGQRVALAWVPVEGSSIDGLDGGADLRSWGKERLAPAKVPTLWKRIDRLPRTPMGKVVKSEVSELFT